MNIAIENVTKVYGRGFAALKGISLEIKTGMFGLLGPNGAGKTTLMRIIATLLRPTDGFVKVGEYRTDGIKDKWLIRSMLGYLPQELSLYGDLSAKEFLDFIGAMKGCSDRPRQVKELLELTGLSNAAKKHIKTYSGGMKRRLGIAQALIGNPSLLIVDEPTVGLDPEERTRFRNMLVDLSSERTVILSSHIVEDIAQTCYQAAILNQGNLLFSGTVNEITRQADGRVWEYTSSEEHRSPDVVVVAKTRIHEAQIKYRVLAEKQPSPNAALVSPDIEDGYLWLMKKPRVN